MQKLKLLIKRMRWSDNIDMFQFQSDELYYPVPSLASQSQWGHNI